MAECRRFIIRSLVIQRTLSILPAVVALGFALCQPAVSAPKDERQVRVLRVPDGGLQPQAVVDRHGALHIVYLTGEPRHGDIFYARSSDGGRTFSKPIRVNSQQGSAVAAGTIRGAQLSMGKGGRLHVAWNGSATARPKGPLNPEAPSDSPHSGLPMLYSRLNEAGDSFEPQRNLMKTTFGLDGGGSIAADDQGNVYVAWHGKAQGSGEGEGGRQVFVVHSRDDGTTFSREKPAIDQPTGACGCCGMRLFADQGDNLFGLYRSATDTVHRDIYLLLSKNQGQSFEAKQLHEWEIAACPMSSMSFSEGPNGVVAAWETRGQVYWATLDPDTFESSEPVAAPGLRDHRKHPVVVANDEGQTLLVWVTSKGWKKPGDLHWRLFDQKGDPVGSTGFAANLPTWSFGTAFAHPDGSFTVLY